MYDMYPWDSASQGDYPPGPLRSRRDRTAQGPANANTPTNTPNNTPTNTPLETSPARAVQVALDRRDNGGDVEAAAVLSAGARTGQ
jgi:hypothetical protein